MELAREISSWFCLLAGSFFALSGGIGILRLRDVYTRMHAAGMTDTLGAGLILTGLMIQAGATLVTVKLIAVLFFLLLTTPTSTHALARAALSQGVQPRLWDEGEDNASPR